jgi:pimeloyl-ACP methyl ester carboxylesterase
MTTRTDPPPSGLESLVISGGKDRVHPPATVRQVAGRLGAEYVEMAGMSHWLPGEPGWEAVADRILGWLAARPDRAAA